MTHKYSLKFILNNSTNCQSLSITNLHSRNKFIASYEDAQIDDRLFKSICLHDKLVLNWFEIFVYSRYLHIYILKVPEPEANNK